MKHSAFILAALVFLSTAVSYAQPSDRSFIREQISNRGGCRNVAITCTNGDLMLYGRNGWAANYCPKALTDALNELSNNNEFIDDVQLTENGEWLILYGDNGLRWSNIPYRMEVQLRKYNADNEIITSAVFNDVGEWVIITDEHISASSDDVMDWLEGGIEKYGQLWTCCLTDDAAVAVYEGGYRFLGEVPESLKDTLNEVDFDVYRVKIAGTAWFISDNSDENYDYIM